MIDAQDDGTRRISLGRSAELFAVVDVEDYDYLMQFKWNAKRSHPGREQFYARRSQHVQGGERHPGGQIKKETIYMHVEVMRRTGIPQPTDLHTPDHIDTDSLNNRRNNLRWACKSGQRKNQKKRVK